MPETQYGYHYQTYHNGNTRPGLSAYLQYQLFKRKRWVNYALFLITWLTTFFTGFGFQGSLLDGFWYSTGIMSILLSHEMGHYLMCRRHGVAATLPFFIPFPFSPFGTMGAVIKMDGRIPDRRVLFDIGAAGPIAGIFIALPAAFFGLKMSPVFTLDQVSSGYWVLGDSLLFKALELLAVGPLSEGQSTFLHPLAYAGWAGLFFTALNLLPIGQLDGGHVVYALFGEKSRYLFAVFLALFALICIFFYLPWMLFVVILLWMGYKHPPTLNPYIQLDRKRRIIAVLVLIFFVLAFVPVPFTIQ